MTGLDSSSDLISISDHFEDGAQYANFRKAEEELDRLFPVRSIKRVMLVAPPDADVTMFNYSTGKRGRYWNFAPYGLGTIATHLRNLGTAVQIVNLNNVVLKACRNSVSQDAFDFDGSWQDALAAAVEAHSPDIIGLTCMFTQTHKSTVSVCNEIKRLMPDIPVAIGGVHITNSFVNDKTSGSLVRDLAKADLFFVYEAELALKRFIQIVNKEEPVESLSQVYFNSDEKRLYFPNRVTPKDNDLDVIPSHDMMDTAELSRYGRIGSFSMLKEKGTRVTTALSNRGCRARCTFCSVRNFNGMSVRTRSVQSVIDELLMLRNEYGIDHVMWLDDDFLYDRKRTLSLFNEMIRQQVGVTWDCTNGVIAASCTDEIVAAAAESGCIGFNIGMESGNPHVLRKIKKPGTVETFLKAAEVLQKYEQINARVFLMIGFPDETYRMILDTINVSLVMNLDWYNVTILQPLPNTPIFDAMFEEGYLNTDDFEKIRYSAGPYGKHGKSAEKSRDLLSSDFKEAFNKLDLDSVPPKEHLDEIWAYMNFHLNFKRLFGETRPTKVQQLLKYVENITDLISPENAFALYFLGYLQQTCNGTVEPHIARNLDERLQASPYWQERFDDFGLSVDHLHKGEFPQEVVR
ncbi:MAG TPA: B12-binding domain-containing radical SAM protein [Planctomycetaceae bacterium]|nr:B12-binding domain-containing radical SAM protein [Planctomycetaceae bacterium]